MLIIKFLYFSKKVEQHSFNMIRELKLNQHIFLAVNNNLLILPIYSNTITS